MSATTFNPAEYVIENLQSYGQYFNEDRAIPSIYSGLKPSQTKILYGAKLLGLKSTGKNKKVINLVGAVVPFYQHGDASLQGAIAKLGQPWRTTYPLLSIQGNLGSQASLDAPHSGAASSRYIEAKLTPLGELLLDSIGDGTAKMVPNFDNTMEEPEHLFAPLPVFMLLNQKGIGVGTATSVPSFKLSSVVRTTEALIKNPQLSFAQIATMLEPYFAQQPVVVNKSELEEIYSHIPRDKNKSAIRLRAKFEIKGAKIIITNFPPDAYPSKIITQIDKKAEVQSFKDITKAQDTTSLDKSGNEKVSMELYLNRRADAERIVEDLCEHTSLESYVTTNIVLLNSEGKVQEYNIKTALLEWIEIFKQKTTDKLNAEKNKLSQRVEILQGLIKAIGDDIDTIIELIKSSANRSEARTKVMGRGYTEIQANAILDMRLVRLANLEYTNLLNELNQLIKRVGEIETILAQPSLLSQLMIDTMNLHSKLDTYSSLDIVDNMRVKTKVTKVRRAYISKTRGGLTISETESKADWIGTVEEPIYVLSGADTYPVTSERIDFIPAPYLVFTKAEKGEVLHFSKDGLVKRSTLDTLKTTRKAIATKQDVHSFARIPVPSSYAVIRTKQGKVVQFKVDSVPLTQRGAKGVIGIKLAPGDSIVSTEIVRTPLKDIKVQRGI